MSLPSSRAYGMWLSLVRISTGIIWLLHAVPKFRQSESFMPPNGFVVTYVTQGIEKTTGPYHGFLTSVVAPNIGIFAELVRLGEACVGLSLLFGLFTRFGGGVGVILTLNYIAARGGLQSAREWGSIDACLMLLSAISLVLPTGRVFGVDAIFSRRRLRPMPVVAEFVDERPLDGPTAPPS